MQTLKPPRAAKTRGQNWSSKGGRRGVQRLGEKLKPPPTLGGGKKLTTSIEYGQEKADCPGAPQGKIVAGGGGGGGPSQKTRKGQSPPCPRKHSTKNKRRASQNDP